MILTGDCLEILPTLEAESVQCCVTSPPYYGLRYYGTATWEGGDPGCDHIDEVAAAEQRRNRKGLANNADENDGATRSREVQNGIDKEFQYKAACSKCGATRIDSQIGLEPTPEVYVEKLVVVFRKIRRVLRDDGTVWLNLGDSYNGSGKDSGKVIGSRSQSIGGIVGQGCPTTPTNVPGLKPKDLIGIPWMVAFALRQPYYTGRIKDEKDRIWLAAILDGEGSICGTEYSLNGYQKTNLFISITNSDMRIIDKCEQIFPQVMKHLYSKGTDVNKEVFRWDVEQIKNKQAFITELYPYLVAKKKQAIIAWNFLKFQEGLKSKKKGYLPEQMEKRSWMMEILSRLNHGGKIILPSWLEEPPSMYEPGWYLRQDCIWAKPNPMPESVTDRCTKAHEYIFLLSKQAKYFYAAESVKEGTDPKNYRYGHGERKYESGGTGLSPRTGLQPVQRESRNRRSVWTITTKPFNEAHFATFPPEIPEICIKAGTSEKGCCPECGAPWERVVEKKMPPLRKVKTAGPIGEHGLLGGNRFDEAIEVTTTGWRPTCIHNLDPIPCTVLDPFSGAGTTGLVAEKLGRKYIGIELSPEYVAMSERRIEDECGSLLEAL